MASQQDHAWADSLTPQIIEEIFICLENGEQIMPEDLKARVQAMEDAGLIGPLEWIPYTPEEIQARKEYDEFIEQARNDYEGERSLRWHEQNGDC